LGLLTIFFRADHPILIWLNHRHLYLLGLATIVCGLGWSNVLMSIGQLIIIGNWIIEFDFKRKFQALKENRAIWIILLLFILHIIGLAWTEDFKYATKDITVKLPLLAFPIIIGTTQKLKLKEWRLIINVYVVTLLALSIASLGKYLGYWGGEITDKRQLSNFISHIRYGLNLAFAAILLFWFKPLPTRAASYLLGLWFIFCLLLFQLYTGLITLGVTLLVISIIRRRHLFKTPVVRRLFYIATSILLIYLSYQTNQVYVAFNTAVVLSYNQEDMSRSQTINGENFSHESTDQRKENGVYTRRYIARNEIEKEWNKASNQSFKKEQNVDNPIAQRLYRYMSSKGLKKDSLSFSTLSNQEIKAIENGVANYYYFTHTKLQSRLHKTFYELKEFQRTGNASGYSIAMRLVYWETARAIIENNVWFGVGTGDVKIAFEKEYTASNTTLDTKYRKRTHNQILTFGVTFGLIGLTIALFSIFIPLIFAKNKKLAWVFVCMMALSFLTEDTLETQAGITLYSFFYCLLILGTEKFQLNNSE
jgi:O-antigen ligase